MIKQIFHRIGNRNPTTFRRRLMVSTTILSMSLLVVAECAVYIGAREALRDNLDNALLSIARTEVASALDGPAGTVHVHDLARRPITLPGSSGYEKFAQIEDRFGRIIARTENVAPGSPIQQKSWQESRARRGRVVYADAKKGDEVLRCIYFPFRDSQSRPLIAVVGISKLPMNSSLDTLASLLGVTLLVGVIGACVGASRLSHRLTQPLRDIAVAAQSIGGEQMHKRLPPISSDAELHDVITVLNEMLANLDRAFQSQQLLVESQRRFVADASHELRTPLSNLRGSVEVALRHPRSEAEYRETLSVSLKEIDRLSRIVSDLLTLSRADSGQLTWKMNAVDLSSIARTASASFAARTELAGVLVDVAAGKPVYVLGDGDRLREAIDNLLENALRYAPKGSVIKVEVDETNGEAILSIHDDGPGVPESDRERVFERFYRADPSRSRQSGGMGLGLAIVRAITDAHCGKVFVQSDTVFGTTFSLSLPIYSGNKEPSSPEDCSL